MAADALVSIVLEQLASITLQKAQQELSLVVGVEAEVEKLTDTLQSIQAVLLDAEKRQVTEEAVKVWFGKIKDLSYDINDVLDEWSTALLKLQIEKAEINAAINPNKKKVCSCIPNPCFRFNRVVSRRDIALKIKQLNERLDSIAYERLAFNFQTTTITNEPERQRSTSLVDESVVYGRDQDKRTIVSKLFDSSEEERGIQIISIVGLAGMGKTTLAQLAYNSDDVKAHFEKRIWVCVSDPFDELKIARAIAIALHVIDPDSHPGSLNLEVLSQRIQESIAGKKFFLVLDDVWPHDYRKWDRLELSLRSGLHGSRILVTTRDERVAKMMCSAYIHSLVELSKEVCWSVFSQMAFLGRSSEDREKLEEIGRKIADKCKGLPLAAKTLGSLMRFKQTKQEWQNVLDSEMWKLEDVKKGIFAPLLLSYYDLPPALKRCFSYCAVYPKDHPIYPELLIPLWMAQGYLSSREGIPMEMVGEEYFQSLAMRSFFQDFRKDDITGRITSWTMHDIVHDFAQYLTNNECFIMEADPGGRESSVDSSYTKSRHSFVVLAGNAPFPVSIFGRGNLHTLLFPGDFYFDEALLFPRDFIFDKALSDVFRRLKYLRALDLSWHSITKLSTEVGTLTHLRYLRLIHNKFEELPETVCDLCNLQTLDISFCQSLKELPKGIGKLINLRYLGLAGTSQLEFLPKEITRLTSLQMLSDFIVSGDDKREACKLEDLKNLNRLQEDLTIRGLGNLEDVGEAEKEELKSREHLLSLTLDFCPVGGQTKMDDVIEALQPHPNLGDLRIENYGGPLPFPSWMMQLTKLKLIRLWDCPNVVCLPPLGKLLFLERLVIGEMISVKKVGVEFLGVGLNNNDGTGGTSVIIAFPKLTYLSLYSMNAWEEWDVMTAMGKPEQEITIMPCLCSLRITHCPKLKALPHHIQTTSLEKLEIQHCPILEQHLQQQRGEEGGEISHSHTTNIQI